MPSRQSRVDPSRVIYDIVATCNWYKQHIQNMLSSTDLEKVISEYSTTRQIFDYLKMEINHTINNTVDELRDILYKKIVENLRELSIEKIIDYWNVLGDPTESVIITILDEIDRRLQKDLQSLEIRVIHKLLQKNLIGFYRPAIFDRLFEELARRILNESCDEIPNMLKIFAYPVTYGFERLQMLIESLATRVDCPSQQIKWIGRLGLDTDLFYKNQGYFIEVLHKIVDNALDKFDDLSCGTHLLLINELDKLKTSRWYVQAYLKDQVNDVIKEYTIHVVDSLNRCHVSELVKSVLLLYYYINDKEKFLHNIIEILNRDMNKFTLRDTGLIILSLCKDQCAYLADRLDIHKLTEAFRSFISDISSGTLKLDENLIENFVVLKALAQVLKSTSIKSHGTINELDELCVEMNALTNVLSNEIIEPKNTIRLVRSYYWMHELREFASQFCNVSIEMPSLDEYKFEEILRNDLSQRLDSNPTMYALDLRNIIRSLDEIDHSLANNLEKRFNKVRLELGIKFKSSL